MRAAKRRFSGRGVYVYLNSLRRSTPRTRIALSHLIVSHLGDGASVDILEDVGGVVPPAHSHLQQDDVYFVAVREDVGGENVQGDQHEESEVARVRSEGLLRRSVGF